MVDSEFEYLNGPRPNSQSRLKTNMFPRKYTINLFSCLATKLISFTQRRIMAESPSQSGAQLVAHQAESDLASLVFGLFTPFS